MQIKIPFAFRDDRLVHISEVESGSKHGGVCPACNSQLVARKGKTTRHHFAHRPSANCSVETALHKTAKLLLYFEINKAIANQHDIAVSWRCARCGDLHTGNLLRKARAVRLEHSFVVCRPDVTLFDEQDRPIAVIEVVVSHAPEDYVRQFFDNEEIGLLEYHISSDFALDALRPLTHFSATIGSVCTRQKCPECKEPLRAVKLYVVDGKCWKCKSPMKLAMISSDNMIDGPAEFDAATIVAARKKGAFFRRRPPNDAGRRHPTNFCPRCRTLSNEFIFRDYGYLACGDIGDFVGYKCSGCGWRISVKPVDVLHS